MNYSRYGARGWDLLPHGDTIRDIPYLMKDWGRRVFSTVQGAGSRGGYSAVSLLRPPLFVNPESESNILLALIVSASAFLARANLTKTHSTHTALAFVLSSFLVAILVLTTDFVEVAYPI